MNAFKEKFNGSLGKALERYGIATVLVFILLGVIFGWLPSPIAETQQEVTASAALIMEVVEQHDELKDFLVKQADRETKFYRLLCRNTARTEAVSIECDKI